MQKYSFSSAFDAVFGTRKVWLKTEDSLANMANAKSIGSSLQKSNIYNFGVFVIKYRELWFQRSGQIIRGVFSPKKKNQIV